MYIAELILEARRATERGHISAIVALAGAVAWFAWVLWSKKYFTPSPTYSNGYKAKGMRFPAQLSYNQ